MRREGGCSHLDIAIPCAAGSCCWTASHSSPPRSCSIKSWTSLVHPLSPSLCLSICLCLSVCLSFSLSVSFSLSLSLSSPVMLGKVLDQSGTP